MKNITSLKSVEQLVETAALFAGDFCYMYQKYAEAQGCGLLKMRTSMNGVSVIKEVVVLWFQVSVYSLSLSMNQVPTVCNVPI